MLYPSLRADEALSGQVAQGTADFVPRLCVSGERRERASALCAEKGDGADKADWHR